MLITINIWPINGNKFGYLKSNLTGEKMLESELELGKIREQLDRNHCPADKIDDAIKKLSAGKKWTATFEQPDSGIQQVY